MVKTEFLRHSRGNVTSFLTFFAEKKKKKKESSGVAVTESPTNESATDLR
jgi:hypothetical protein